MENNSEREGERVKFKNAFAIFSNLLPFSTKSHEDILAKENALMNSMSVCINTFEGRKRKSQ